VQKIAHLHLLKRADVNIENAEHNRGLDIAQNSDDSEIRKMVLLLKTKTNKTKKSNPHKTKSHKQQAY
jgi:hypothetical protein